jgi:8-oxo-dGTP pyrophosphatase MutT (NUDIX family)
VDERTEVLDVLDENGRIIGRKPRSEVHRDDDWHGLVFVWAAWRSDDRPLLLLQRRGLKGDPFFGRADALASGHIESGQTPLEAARRELVEEVGLEIAPGSFICFASNAKDRPGTNCRRTFQHHFLIGEPLDIEKLSFTDEVDAFLLTDLHEFDAFVRGERDRVGADVRDCYGTKSVELSPDVIDYPVAVLETFKGCLSAIRGRL